MRRFTLLTLAALLTTATGLAQGPAKKLTEMRISRQTTTTAQQQKSPMTLGQTLQSQKGAQSLRNLQPASPQEKIMQRFGGQALKGPRAVKKAGIVTDQPAGNYMLFSRSGEAYGSSLFGVLYAQVEGKVCEMVLGEKNTVYMKDIISQFGTGAWIQGQMKGTTITFNLPQAVYEESGATYYAMMMQLNAAGNSYEKAASQQLTFNYDQRSGIVTSATELADGSTVVGLASEDGGWTGYADWNISMKTVKETPAQAPEGLTTADYAISAPGMVGSIAQVGFQGNEVWVKGIYANMPDAWVHGTIDGNKATFPSGQYLGADLTMGYFQYLVSATAEEVYDEYYGTSVEYSLSGDDITFDYDATTGELTNGTCFLINAGTGAVSYAAAFDQASMKPFTEVAATPMTPEWNGISEYGFDYFYEYQYGWGVFDFEVFAEDADGNFILPEKLSYIVYTRVNGEVQPYTFSWYDHIYQAEPTMTEVAFDYDDGWDIGVSGTNHTVYFFNGGAEAYGVQAVYRGGGEERRSEIAWYEMQGLFTDIQPEAATPDYPEIDPANQGSSITVSPYTGNENRTTFGNWTPQTYDVAIRLSDEALAGSHIDQITFPVQAIEGTSGYKVWLTSQLRVENNQNVPDIVSIDVEPTATGYTTVMLPKPYLIPEGGVYVGYSVTIDEESSAEGGPVATIDQAKPSGMYLHMSRNLLKWQDLSQDASMSAIIEVTVSGSSIADNAVAPVAGSNVYVKTGDEVTLTQEFVNHGAAGIQTMDLEYTLDGKTYTKTVSARTKGQFGLSAYATLTMPGLSEAGTYPVSVKVVKVNGQDNMDAAPEATTTVMVLNTVPTKRTLLEEYTGTWCGWCTRGLVALELLKKNYEDDFVAVSYHNSDPMEIITDFPSPVSGFPAAWVDRGMSVDPYGGEPYDDSYFSTLDILQWRNSMFANADLDASAQLSEDGEEIVVKASVTFPYSDDNANFALEYVLVEDGMTGPEGTEWDQNNYYAGESGLSADLTPLASQGEVISGMVFNDVAVAVSEIGGISGSVPQAVVADEAVEHIYTFYPSYCYNTSWEPIIQDLEQLYVVAMLIDLSDGTVANAVKVKVVTPQSVGIETVGAKQSAEGRQDIYNLQGQRIGKMQKGVNIVGGRKVMRR